MYRTSLVIVKIHFVFFELSVLWSRDIKKWLTKFRFSVTVLFLSGTKTIKKPTGPMWFKFSQILYNKIEYLKIKPYPVQKFTF